MPPNRVQNVGDGALRPAGARAASEDDDLQVYYPANEGIRMEFEEDVNVAENGDDGSEDMSEGEQDDDMVDQVESEGSDSEAEVGRMHVLMPRARNIMLRNRMIDMPEFLRMLAPLPGQHARGSSNDDLIRHLKRSVPLSCKRVATSMQVCPRDIFVPAGQKHEAFEDHPLRLDDDFNISAPHMHASMTQALGIEEGDHVLDVGSGCGVTTAMFAYLAGKKGCVVGLELRSYALGLSTAALDVMLNRPEYARVAAPVSFEQGNAFIAPEHEGRYDKVHVGGSCPPHKLHLLLRLLKPDAGVLVVPAGSDLLKFTRSNGETKREVINHVRFGELEVPLDADIALGHLDLHRRSTASLPLPRSPYGAEMAGVLAAASRSASRSASGVTDRDDAELDVRSACTCTGLAPAAVFSASGSSSRGSSRSLTPASSRGGSGALATPLSAPLFVRLGPPDCTVIGDGFKIPAHAAVLRARCQLLRAQLEAGLSDAAAASVTLPSNFAQAPAQACIDYLYTDDVAIDEANALAILAIAHYLGTPHLVSRCSAFISLHLQSHVDAAALDSAADILAFASEHGLDALCRFCAAFLAVHVAEARRTAAYAALGPKQLDAILEAVAQERELLVAQLRGLSPAHDLPQ